MQNPMTPTRPVQSGRAASHDRAASRSPNAGPSARVSDAMVPRTHRSGPPAVYRSGTTARYPAAASRSACWRGGCARGGGEPVGLLAGVVGEPEDLVDDDDARPRPLPDGRDGEVGVQLGGGRGAGDAGAGHGRRPTSRSAVARADDRGHGAPVDPFRNFGRIPGLSDLLTLLQQQTEALAQLPRTLTDLQGTVRQLTEATNTARDTIASAQRTAERLETLVEELEEPVRALPPGLERVGRILDAPAVDTVPETLRRIHDDLMPLIHGMRLAQERMGTVTGSVAGLLRRRSRPEDEPRPDGEPGG